MRSLSLILVAGALASCTTAPQAQLQRSEGAEIQLQRLIAGSVAGKPQSCLPNYRAENMIVIDDSTVFYRSGSQLYRQDFGGGRCRGLRSGYTLVTKQFSGTLCRGDLAQVVDGGSTVGNCVIGDFVPYSMAAR